MRHSVRQNETQLALFSGTLFALLVKARGTTVALWLGIMATLYGWRTFVGCFPHARLLWNVEAGNGTLRAYGLNGKVVLIHDYANGDGWTAYVDPFTALGLDETLRAIGAHCSAEVNLDREPHG
jgi:hypothetical protein